MSWASKRRTTREEDRAYSLMGLFGVHMPTIYGEGSQAFIRLQHEIMKHSNDHSIFAWLGYEGQITTLSRFKFERKPLHSTTNYGFLASSPDLFAYANIAHVSYKEYMESFVIVDPLPEHSVTNHGIRMRLPVVPRKCSGYWAGLACAFDDGSKARGRGRSYICIWLQPCAGTINQYYRANKDLILVDEDLTRFATKDVYILQTSGRTLSDILNINLCLNSRLQDSRFQFTIEGAHNNDLELLTSIAGKKWQKTKMGLVVTMLLPLQIFAESKFDSAVFRGRVTGQIFAAVIGVDRVPAMRYCDGRVWLDILVEDEDNWLSTSSAEEREHRLKGMYEGSVLQLNPDHPRRRCSDKIMKRFGQGWLKMTVREQAQKGHYVVRLQMVEDNEH
ncbi:hypothetical protein A0H81_09933 [Grifola frondosa]|uniref:DUF8212 domain-containing protein n=1 Tax=Grifola frondosa TaxID=5627 RepID=A0A1C7LZH1_GRIFR|nr:hypothetical protein A0H81_09933 [Grifola frondosa]